MIRSRTGHCVVFDLDDTIYDEIDFVRSGYEAVADAVFVRFGVDCRGRLRELLERRQLAGAFQTVATGQLPAAALDHMIEVYRAHQPSIRPRGGMAQLLATLKERDGVVGCITDGRSATQRAKIAALGLDAILEPVLVSGETGHTKPDPHNFLEAMRLIRADSYCYVADNPAKDFVAPNALGWITVGIDSPNGIHRGGGAPAVEYRPQHQLPLSEAIVRLSRPGLGGSQ